MQLRVLTWNVRKAGVASPAWSIMQQLDADIMLLQEVGRIPDTIKSQYAICQKTPLRKNGQPQIFSTAVLAKEGIVKEQPLHSAYDWVNKELALFSGNLVACEVQLNGFPSMNVMSVYSPPWPVNSERISGINTAPVQLTLNSQVWCTELLWAVLSNSDCHASPWLVGGDFNSSVTFDYMWKGGPRGNQEIIDRMQALGFKECLCMYMGGLTPTYKNASNGKVIHQIDHLYANYHLYPHLTKAVTGNNFSVFENSISDHLPIISDFELADY